MSACLVSPDDPAVEYAASEVYDALEAACLPHIEHYQGDLIQWDRKAISENPGVPFLHWTTAMGTHIVLMPPESDYPAKGVEIPYLFGTADRWHLVRQVEYAVKYQVANTRSGDRLCHYFDGKRLRVVTDPLEALNIAKTYCRRIVLNW